MNRTRLHKRLGGMNILEVTLLFAVVTLPLNYLLNSYSIVLFAIATLLSDSPAKKMTRLRENSNYWILPLFYFVWMTIVLIWDKGSTFSVQTGEDLESSASWFVFPILFATIDRIDSRSIKKILLAFVVSNLGASLYCLFKAYLEYKSTN